ncbi:MAG: UDP binding domain-containing protein, partial [Phycisphaerales bacterium JB038]
EGVAAFQGFVLVVEDLKLGDGPLAVVNWALEAGAKVQAYDPVAADNSKRAIPQLEIFDNQYEALEGCDALIISTEWDEFRQPDFTRLAEALKTKTIFDGRNLYRLENLHKLGFSYYSVGRPPVNAKHACTCEAAAT